MSGIKPIINVLTSGSKRISPYVGRPQNLKVFTSELRYAGDELCLGKTISLEEVKKLFPSGKLENNYIIEDIKDLLKKIKTDKKLVDLTPQLNEEDYIAITQLMNLHNGAYISKWKEVDGIPNMQKLALFTRTMRLTSQTKEFVGFDLNRWDIIVDGIIRKPREAITPLLEYKASSKEINEALSDLSKMKAEIQQKIDIISKYLDGYTVKKDFTVYRGDKTFDILPIIDINGQSLNLAQSMEIITKQLRDSFLKNKDISEDIKFLAEHYFKPHPVPQSRFMSTAMIESATKDYAKKIKWKITVPKGTKGTSIESYNIERKNEAEFLAQKGGQFRITNATYKPEEDLWYFDAILEQ